MIETIALRDGKVRYLDQTLLPAEEVYLETTSWQEIADAIRRLAVRGAPLIGVSAAMGVVLAALETRRLASPAARAAIETAIDGLAATRPTAVNLFWALDRMRGVLARLGDEGGEVLARALEAEAIQIHEEDLEKSREIGRHGAALVPDGARIITHCNAGGLATGGLGTALAVIYEAHRQGKKVEVLADETRPLLQGARLTAWELHRSGVPVTLITDSMAGAAMARLGVDLVVVGADRIALNGDTANKIGTYPLAVVAGRHGVPFYVAAPTTTVDPDLPTGERIPIEERSQEEVLGVLGVKTAAPGVRAWNPAFDVTPSELVSAIVTEQGVKRPPFTGQLTAAPRPAGGARVGAGDP